jgi:hypothetical protein
MGWSWWTNLDGLIVVDQSRWVIVEDQLSTSCGGPIVLEQLWWTNCGGTISGLTRTPPFDFIRWKCVKDYVYRASVDDTVTLCAKIINAIHSAAEVMSVHGQNWTIGLMWLGPPRVPMLRWSKVPFDSRNNLQSRIFSFWLPCNKFLK